MFGSNVGLLRGHLRSSYKMIIISSIGLIFALGIISSTIIYVDTSRPTIFQDSLNQQSQNRYYNYYGPNQINPFPDYTYRRNDFNIYGDISELKSNLTSFTQYLQNTIDVKVEEFNLRDKIKEVKFFTQYYSPPLEINGSWKYFDEYNIEGNPFEMINTSLTVFEISEEVRSELQILLTNSGIGTVPTNNTELMLLNLLPQNDIEIAEEANINVSFYTEKYLENPPYVISTQHNFSLTGVIKINEIFYSRFPDLVETLIDHGGRLFGFVTDLKEFSETFQTSSQDDFYKRINLRGGIRLNYESFDPYTAREAVSDLKKFAVQLKNSINRDLGLYTSSQYFDIYFESEWNFEMAISAVDGITFGLLLFASPIILVTLFVANYSFGLIHRSIKQHIGIYKTRGASDFLVFSMQLLDFFIIIAISIVLSIALGFPMSILIIRTDYFLSFNNDTVTSIIINLPNLISTLFWAGLFIGILIHISRMLKLAKMTIAETESTTEKTEPYWLRHHLDIIFLVVGLIGFFIFYSSITQQWFFLGGIFILLGLPTPFLIIIGAILFFSRIFPIVLSRISSIIWIKFGGLIAFAIKNVIRHKQASTRAVMLIAVLIAFLVSFLSLPYSSVIWNTNRVAYNYGAEGVGYTSFGEDNYYNATLVKILEENYSNYFDGISPFLRLTSYENQFASIIVVNTTTLLDAAIFPINPDTRYGLENDMTLLQENTTKFNLLIQQKSFNYLDLKIGDNHTYGASYFGSPGMSFRIVDTFKTWPTLFFEAYPGYEGDSFYGITSFDHFLATNYSFQQSPFQINRAGFYFDFKEGVNKTQLSEWLFGNFSITMETIDDELEKFFSGSGFLVQIGQINLNIVISIFIATTILLMFAWLQVIERKKELYTERALGLKVLQLFVLFIIESFILLISGLIIGTVMGIGLTEMFGLFITLGPTIPPYVTIFAVDLIINSFIIILIFAFFGSILPAFYVTRQDISSSFAGEG